MSAVSPRRPNEVLVIGAGPTGLTAALELTRRGHGVHIIEKDLRRSRFSKALTITAGTLRRLEFCGRTLPDDWSFADIRATLPITGMDDGPAIILGDRRLIFALRIRGDLFRVASNLPGVTDHLPDCSVLREIVWQADFTVGHRLVESCRVGRACLAGDAAHIHSPLGGRGMNLGIEDAVEFARLKDEDRLDDYHSLRHARGAQIVRMVSAMTRLMTSRNVGPRMFRRAVLPCLLRLPLARNALARRMVNA